MKEYKEFLIYVAVILILLTCLFAPAFAAGLDECPVYVPSTIGNLNSNGLLVARYNQNRPIYVSANKAGVYPFFYLFNSATGQYRMAFASADSSAIVYYSYSSTDVSNTPSSASVSSASFYDTYGLYYYGSVSVYTSIYNLDNIFIPYYSSLEAGLSAISGSLPHGPNPYLLAPGESVSVLHQSTPRDFVITNTSSVNEYVGLIYNDSSRTEVCVASGELNSSFSYKWNTDQSSYSALCNVLDSTNSIAVYYFDDPTNHTGETLIDVFDSYSTYCSAVASLLDSPSVTLVSPEEDFSWSNGFSFENDTSGVYAAAGTVSYSSGNSFGMIASYSPNVSFSGLKAGQSANWNLSWFDSSTQLYYTTTQITDTLYDSVAFETLSGFLDAAVLVLDDYPGGSSTAPGTFTLPAGYVGYLHLSDPEVDINLSTTFNNNSSFINLSGSAWPSNQTYKYETTLPYGSREFPTEGSSLITWYKDAGGQTNLFGQTKSAKAVLHPSGNLIEIYNPYYQNTGVGESEDGQSAYWVINPTINGSTTGIMSWVIYPIEDNLSLSNFSGIVSSSPDGFSDPYIGVNDGSDNYNNFTNQSGTPVTPAPGGYNEPPTGSTIQDIIENFTTRFFALFSEGHNAIRNLTQSASEFVSQLSSLYTWLPAPVLSVLSSAIILAIIIGVLKVFL